MKLRWAVPVTALIAGIIVPSLAANPALAQTGHPQATMQQAQPNTEYFNGFDEQDASNNGAPQISLNTYGPIIATGSITLTPGILTTLVMNDGRVTVIHQTVSRSSTTVKTRYDCVVSTNEFGHFWFAGGTGAWRGAYSPHGPGNYYVETKAWYERLPGGSCPNPNDATPIVATYINFAANGQIAKITRH